MPKGFPIRAVLLFVLLVVISILVFSTFSHARPQIAAGAEQPYAIEYYYKTKWGHADEFITLFRKNHFPLLKKEMEMGRIKQVFGTVPVYHTTEDGRWDYRITIVYKNAAIANDEFDSEQIKKQMYPDQETYKKEEQRRFEILDAHWDLPVKELKLEGK